ncbi:MAG TPA: CapA family protein [Acetobacteraceae bacterium]|nr:CapA family protein [Acetobacteraceae bacterium]
MAPLSLLATGDSFITRRLPGGPEQQALAALIGAADVRFTNFEVLTPGAAAVPNAVSGGTWASAPEAVIADLVALGFNMASLANNHTLDYLHDGMAATARALDAHGMLHAGTGIHLADASRPRYLECPTARVALIAITASFHETSAAGEQRPAMRGRPGVNMLRHTSTYTLPPDKLRALQALAEESGVNDGHKLRVKEGFAPPLEDGVVLFGGQRFRAGPQLGVQTTANKYDVARVVAAIGEAKRQADHVLISLHAHEMLGAMKTKPAAFLEAFSRACIDAGAHAVIGHGPHILRGIELYRGRPILYSLGNFIFHNETIDTLPSDFYEKFDLGLTANVADGIDKRSAVNTRGFAADPWAWKSVIARWHWQDDALADLELIPVELGYGLHRARRGTPKLSADPAILPHLAELSAPYGTKIEIVDGVGRVKMK